MIYFRSSLTNGACASLRLRLWCMSSVVACCDHFKRGVTSSYHCLIYFCW